MQSFSVQLGPKAIGYILLGVFVSIIIALSGHAIIRERGVVAWKGTIVSSASSSTAFVQEPVAVEPALSISSSSHPEVLSELNRYWLERVNQKRREKQLQILVTDQRLIDTAGEWAAEMERRGEISHVRMDGKNMHQWIDAKQLDFTERNVEGGWKRNYFVENIARFYAEPSTEGLKAALDKILVDFLDEGPGGAHYESIYHLDWNSVGLGYAVHSAVGESPRIYFAFHYGSLKPVQP